MNTEMETPETDRLDSRESSAEADRASTVATACRQLVLPVKGSGTPRHGALIALALMLLHCTDASRPPEAGTTEVPTRDEVRGRLERIFATGVVLDWSEARQTPTYIAFFPNGAAVPGTEGLSPEETALAFFESTSFAWGLRNPRTELSARNVLHHEDGTATVKIGQVLDGIPVEPVAINVSLDPDGRVRTVIGALAPRLMLAAPPLLRAAEAAAVVQQALPRGKIGTPTQVVVAPSVFEAPVPEQAFPAWRVTADLPERSVAVYVDARDGTVRHLYATGADLYRQIYEPLGPLGLQPLFWLEIDEGVVPPARFPTQEQWDVFTNVGIFDQHLSSRGILSFSSKNDWYKSSTDNDRPGGTAFDFGGGDPTKAYAAFAPRYSALDVVSHEWAHGLLLFTGNLYSFDVDAGPSRIQFEASTLHEGFADVLACYIEGIDWRISKPNGFLRALDAPETIGNGHDHNCEFEATASMDAKYRNSTIFSMAGYLIGDTGVNLHPHSRNTFQPQGTCMPGSGVPVAGLGRAKAERIYLLAIQDYLYPTADFKAARWAVLSACNALAASGSAGISAADCDTVYAAFREVGITGYGFPTVGVTPLAGSVESCIEQGGSGFPPSGFPLSGVPSAANQTLIDLNFQDLTSGTISHVLTPASSAGIITHSFGLDPSCGAAANAEATAFLDRVDPQRRGFSNRPMRYWAEYQDGGTVRSNVVDFTLSSGGSCQPACAGKTCGPDGCGGVCGLCPGTQRCVAGSCAVATAPALTVCGTAIGSVHWTTAQSPVLVNCDVTVTGTLTIDPGVQVRFASSDTDFLIATGGSLVAVGTGASPIVFTSNSGTSPGSWGGIDIVGDAGVVKIQHAEFRYAGSTTYGAVQFPISLSGRNQPEISNITFLNNRRNAIGLKYGNYSSAVRLNVAGINYVAAGDVVINAGVTMTIDPGVVLKFENSDSDLQVNGRLVADGTASKPIYLTALRDDSQGIDAGNDGAVAAGPANWGGVVLALDGTQAASSIHNAVIRYAGSTTYGASRYPVLVNARTQPSIGNLSLLDNRRNAVAVMTGTYANNLRLNVVGPPYLIDGDVTVNSGATMTVDPGVVVRFEGSDTDLTISGRLLANGTAAQPIFFTSIKDDAHGGDAGNDGTTAPGPENWGGIVLGYDATQAASSLVNTVVTYGGSTTYGATRYPILVNGRSQPTVTGVSLVGNRRNALALMTGTYANNLRLNVVGVPYLIDGDVTVNSGVTMTIDAGVTMRFEGSDTDLIVNGRLLASGTAEQPVYFTSLRDDTRGGDAGNDGTTSPGPSNWGGVVLNYDSTQPASSLVNVVVSYGGSTTYGAYSYPILVNGRTQPTVSAVSLLNNRRNALALMTGTYANNLRLNVVGVPYLIDRDVTINAGVTMTVDPGVVMRLEGDDSDLVVNGRLLANGTPEQPIAFTSLRDDARGGDVGNDGATAPGAGNWGGIVLGYDGTQPASSLVNVSVNHAGSTVYGAYSYPILVNGRTQPTVSGVSLLKNRRNAIALMTGTYANNLRLNVVGVPYLVDTDVTVNAGVTMTVDPGVVVKMEGNATNLFVNGTLVAGGSDSQPFVFTSVRDDTVGGDTNNDGTSSGRAEDWGGIALRSTSSGTFLRSGRLAFGGSATYGAITAALWIEGGAPVVEGIEFDTNEDAVAVIGGQPDLGGGTAGSKGGNRFLGHAVASNSWAVYNSASSDVYARDNWWGSASSSQIDGVIFDRKDDSSKGFVIYSNFKDCVIGSACSDGNSCTSGDSCQGGHCLGTAYSCNSPGSCESATGATCNGTGGCAYPAATGATCDDGVACTVSDRCQANKSCAGTAYTCPAPDQCHQPGTCTGGGACTYAAKPDNTACNDGSACTSGEVCRAGTCGQPTSAVTCSASDQCHTAGSCDSATGQCSDPAKANGVACDDANACTSRESCQSGVCGSPATTMACGASDQCHAAGTCDPASGLCSNPARSDGAICDDANACTSGESCRSGVCGSPTATTTCAPLDQCHDAGVCNPATNTCTNPAKAGGSACSDGRSCTTGDNCQAGACVPTARSCACSTDADCPAVDQCHGAGTCNASTGACTGPSKSDGTTCNDGSACTSGETCRGGACGSPSTTVSCAPSDQCHLAGSCDPGTGQCSNPAKANGAACSDGSACTAGETCQGGTCGSPSTNVTCTPFDQCHATGTCDPGTGQCSNPSKEDGTTCSDGSACTSGETCRNGSCGAPSATVACTASDQCHVGGSCDPATGQCSNPIKENGTACSDASACTTGESCQSGICDSPTTRVACTPSDQCHVAGACDPSDGTCTNPLKADDSSCDDGSACTAGESCQHGTCGSPVTTVTCGAQGQCRDAGTCDAATGRCSTPAKVDGTACTDSDACTRGETCQNGGCGSPSSTIECTPVDQCHDSGACDAETGSCTKPAKLEAAQCDDGRSCTSGDRCVSGACAPVAIDCACGSDADCSPLDQCHAQGTCDLATGKCSAPAKPEGTSCNDGSFCTRQDVCVAGTCTGTNPIICAAFDQCHRAGACDPATGECSNPAQPESTPCDDQDACTTGEECHGGLCGRPASTIACSPSNQCHDAGRCDPQTGICSNPAKPDLTACDDHNACTTGETCRGGSCGQPESEVSCTPSAGCPLVGECDPSTAKCADPRKANGDACETPGRPAAGPADDDDAPRGCGGCDSSGTGLLLSVPLALLSLRRRRSFLGANHDCGGRRPASTVP